ncbi:transcription factor GTE8-like isoform X2 [Musa acuminata AAA Group]|uniref:transcription factor GTE8-like isoform X2 n=1 Tax=Musa acuminata AAA Group TaxID=214697 RepID=UPI0031E05926
MAPTVLLEYTKEKQMKRSSHDLSFATKGRKQKLSQGYRSGSINDYQHNSEKINESEGFGIAIRADSSDNSSAPKRKKCVNANVARCNDFGVPVQVISLSKMSGSQREEVKMRLRSELGQIQLFQKQLFSRSVTSLGISTSSSFNVSEKKHDPRSGSQMRRGISGRFESSKTNAPPPPVTDSNLVLMKECEVLLSRLMTHHYAWVFNEPVDVEKLNIPDYYTVIKHPMDFGTISTKLSSDAYPSPQGFAADVRLTFTNAMTYNPPSNSVHIMANKLSKFFETRWKTIEKKLAAADAVIKKEFQVVKPEFSSSKRKMAPTDDNNPVPKRTKPKMTDEEKQSLTRLLESLLADLPDHIIDFLRRRSGNVNQSSDEIEIDIESFADDTLFELQNLLDSHMQEREMRHQAEQVNENGVSTSQLHPCKGNDLADEEVDICGDDPPMSSYPTLEIQMDTKATNVNCSSSSNSSSDSDSDSSSESESEDEVTILKNAKKNSGNKAGSDQEKSDVMNPFDVNRPSNGLNFSENDADPKPLLVGSDECQEGDHTPSERKVSPEKLYRAALLRSRFADTIVKAREKTLGQCDKGDPEKLQREREEIERQQREEKARLQAEAKAAEDARKRAEAAAAAEAKRKIELEREAARQALLKIEKTVDINEDCRILKDLEMLGTVPAENEKHTGYSLDGIGGFRLGGSNPLERLGLFMKVDDEEEEEVEHKSAPVNDVEEGEID